MTSASGYKSLPDDWADLAAGFIETFGPGVRITLLRLPSIPGWQLGESLAQEIRRRGGWLETYEHNMPGFGPPIEDETPKLPEGWKRHGDAPRGTKQ